MDSADQPNIPSSGPLETPAVIPQPVIPEPASLPPQKSNNSLKILLIISVLILLGLIIAVVVVLLSPKDTPAEPKIDEAPAKVSKYAAEPCEYTDLWPAETNGVKNYCLSERDSWVDFKDIYEEVCDSLCPDRMKKDENGKTKTFIKETFNLDTAEDADYNYFVAMWKILQVDYMLDEIEVMAHKAAYTNPGEVDATNLENAKRLQETWNRFLAHEDLDYDFDTTFDGQPFVYDGKYTGTNEGVANYTPTLEPTTNYDGTTTEETVKTQEEKIDPSDIPALETWSTNYNPSSPDSDGTYVEAIKTYVSKFGMELDFEFSHIYEGCYMSEEDRTDGEEWIEAAYCHATPRKIFINNKFAIYDKNLKASAIVDSIKHEMAHHLIGETCLTPTPPITAGKLPEAITSSFAVLFLGADRATLDVGSPERYHTSDTTDDIARQIHDLKKCY
jgi:hypothetical protein